MTTHSLIYRSDKKQETYLYLAVGTSFRDLPQELQDTFGEPALVMKLEIHPDTRLARADTGRVLDALAEQGYFLQLPPKTPVEEMITRRFGSPDGG